MIDSQARDLEEKELIIQKLKNSLASKDNKLQVRYKSHFLSYEDLRNSHILSCTIYCRLHNSSGSVKTKF